MTNDCAWPKFHLNLLGEVILVVGLKETPFSLTIQAKHRWQLRDWCFVQSATGNVSAIIWEIRSRLQTNCRLQLKCSFFCQVNTAECIVSKHDVKNNFNAFPLCSFYNCYSLNSLPSLSNSTHTSYNELWQCAVVSEWSYSYMIPFFFWNKNRKALLLAKLM